MGWGGDAVRGRVGLCCLRQLTRLHADEAAPDEHGGAVQQPCDDVAEQQHCVCPVAADVLREVSAQLCAEGARVFRGAPAEQRGFLVHGRTVGRGAGHVRYCKGGEATCETGGAGAGWVPVSELRGRIFT